MITLKSALLGASATVALAIGYQMSDELKKDQFEVIKDTVTDTTITTSLINTDYERYEMMRRDTVRSSATRQITDIKTAYYVGLMPNSDPAADSMDVAVLETQTPVPGVSDQFTSHFEMTAVKRKPHQHRPDTKALLDTSHRMTNTMLTRAPYSDFVEGKTQDGQLVSAFLKTAAPITQRKLKLDHLLDTRNSEPLINTQLTP